MSGTSKLLDAPAGPPSRYLRFYPVERSAHEFIKTKITHPYPFRFLLLYRSTLRLPHPEHGCALPLLLLCAPSAIARLRLSPPPVAHAACSLPSRALVLLVLALPVASAARPVDRSPVLTAVVLACAVGVAC